jgi:RES domain-containing protein
VYTAGTQSLAALEILVHTAGPNDLVDLGFVAIPIVLEERMIADVARLFANRKSYPVPLSTMRIGDAWVRAGGSVALRVPGVVIPAEWNYPLNPAHPDLEAVAIGKPGSFAFDRRLAFGAAGPKRG